RDALGLGRVSLPGQQGEKLVGFLVEIIGAGDPVEPPVECLTEQLQFLGQLRRVELAGRKVDWYAAPREIKVEVVVGFDVTRDRADPGPAEVVTQVETQ